MRTAILLLLFSYSISAQIVEGVEFYERSDDFVYNQGDGTSYEISCNSIGPYHLEISQVYTESDKREERLLRSWAIKYKDDYYVNLLYGGNISQANLFIKLDSVGSKYSYSIIHRKYPEGEESPNFVGNVIFSSHRGFEPILSLAANGLRWRQAWTKEDGNKAFVLLFDFSDYALGNKKRNTSTVGEIVTRNTLQKKFLEEVRAAKAKGKIKLEDVIHMININNEELID